jgi:hypothetical protein
MAVGARITSENLSGKTATVTFIPYTGQTSGSTVNLGTKTIPFNNINIHPYGVYNLYFAEYDYTYTLTIPEPVLNTQTVVYVSRMVNDNNFGAATLNFNDFTATVIDLDVDTNSWYIDDVVPLTNSGYGYHFRGQSNNNDRLILFTDASNTEIGRYNSPEPTSDVDFDVLDGRWITYIDYDLGLFKYSNGVNVYTYEFDGSRYMFDIQWDWDATMSDTSFIVIKYDMSQGTDNHALKFNADGTQTTLKSWSSLDNFGYNFTSQFNSDFFVVEKRTEGASLQLEVCGLDGTVLETVSLTGQTYSNYNDGFQGTNKYFYITWNGSDNNVDYKIIHYNFDTTTLIETSHEKGNAFPNIEWRSDGDFWPEEYGKQNLMITFSNYGSINNWGNFAPEVTYMDVMYIFGNQSSFTTFTFAADETKYIWPWFDLTGTNMFRARCNNGDDIASILTIMSGSTRIQSLNIPVSGVTNNFSDWDIDDRTVYRWYGDNNYTGATYVLINATGGTQDQLTLEFIEQYGNNESRSEYKVFYLGHNTIANGYEGWYINNNTTGFTSTGYYNNQTDPDWYFKPNFIVNPTLLLTDNGRQVGRVLTATSLSDEFSIPDWYDNFRREVGESMFAILYDDTTQNNYYHIKLYDFDGELLNTLDTTYTSYDDFYAIGDRIFARFFNSSTDKFDMYMISADSIQSVSLDDYGTDWAPNDYLWWDDY